MPIRTELYEDGRILYTVIEDPWNEIDIKASERDVQPYYDSARFKVHSLFNVSNTRNIALNLMRHSKTLLTVHPNAGKVAVVGASPTLQMIAKVLFRLARAQQDRLRFFDGEAEAWEFLRAEIMRETEAERLTEAR